MITNRNIITFCFTLFTLGCDPQRLKECEWYLEPDVNHVEIAHEGFVSLCVRNYKIGKQKCYLEMEYQKSVDVFQKKIRYSTLEIDHSVFPRKVLSYKICEGET